jgi:fumarate reductase subunit C
MAATTSQRDGETPGTPDPPGTPDVTAGRHQAPAAAPKTYRPPLSPFWWLHNRRYFLFMLREATAVPIVLWLVVLLVDLARLGAGPGPDGAAPRLMETPLYVAFSVVCLVFALLHSVTWLGISGLILRVPLGERDLAPRLVTAANFGLWAVVTLVVGALLILLGR